MDRRREGAGAAGLTKAKATVQELMDEDRNRRVRCWRLPETVEGCDFVEYNVKPPEGGT